MRTLVVISIIVLTVFTLTAVNSLGEESAEGVVVNQVIPEWIKPSSIPSAHLADRLKGKSIHYYLFDQQVLVDEEVKHYTQVMKQLLDPNAVAEDSQLNIDFDPSYQQIILHHVDVFRGGEKIDKLGDADIRVVSQERELNNLIYEGEMTASIILKDIRKNDIIDYAYTMKGFNPVFGNKYHGSFSLGWSLPVDKVKVRINMVGKRPLNYKTLLSNIRPDIQKEGNVTSYEWVIEKTEPIRSESNTPKWVIQYPQLQVSEYENWAEVAEWANKLFSAVVTSDDSVDRWLVQWLDTSSSNQVLDILSFVQDDIRYLGLEFGESSHKPYAPSEVLRNRYGDCKDKSLLLSTLLNSIGIKATPALVSSRYGKAINDWLPSPSAFDHAIVKINTETGEYWVDPTRTQQSGSLSHRYISNIGRALLVAPSQTTLVNVPRNNQSNDIKVTEKFFINSLDKPVILNVESNYFGPIGNSKKNTLTSQRLEEAKSDFFNYYSSIYHEIEPKYEVDVHSDENLPATNISESYVLKAPWKENVNYLSLETVAEAIGKYTKGRPKQPRTTPYSISSPINIHSRAEVYLPVGSVVDLSGNEVKIENELYRYQRSVEQEGNKVVINHFYQTKNDYIKPDQVETYLADMKMIQKSLTYWVNWEKATYKSLKSRLNRLKGLAHSDEN